MKKENKSKDTIPGACSCMTLTSKTGKHYWFRTCDIETDISEEGFADPKDAKMPITTISMMIGNKVVVLGTRPLETEGNQTQSDVCAQITDRIRRYISDPKVSFAYIMYPSELAMMEALF